MTTFDEASREDLGSAVVGRESPDEYRLTMTDPVNKLALHLSRGISQMTFGELQKLDASFRKRVTLADPPTATSVMAALATVGMCYVEAIGEAAQRRAADLRKSDSHAEKESA